MTVLRDQMSADLSSIFYNTDDFAELVTYTPAGEASRIIPAIISYDKGLESRIDAVNAFGAAATMRIRAGGPDGIATVTNQDTVLIDGVSWHVGSPYTEPRKIGGGLEWEIELHRDSLAELCEGFQF